jgi:hypothetical protein
MDQPTPAPSTEPAPTRKPLHVHVFASGHLGIMCNGMGIHLNPADAIELAHRLFEIYLQGEK